MSKEKMWSMESTNVRKRNRVVCSKWTHCITRKRKGNFDFAEEWRNLFPVENLKAAGSGTKGGERERDRDLKLKRLDSLITVYNHMYSFSCSVEWATKTTTPLIFNLFRELPLRYVGCFEGNMRFRNILNEYIVSIFLLGFCQ